MAPLPDHERRDFLEICDDRYATRSTILTSQVRLSHWHDQIDDPTVADSILDWCDLDQSLDKRFTPEFWRFLHRPMTATLPVSIKD